MTHDADRGEGRTAVDGRTIDEDDEADGSESIWWQWSGVSTVQRLDENCRTIPARVVFFDEPPSHRPEIGDGRGNSPLRTRGWLEESRRLLAANLLRWTGNLDIYLNLIRACTWVATDWIDFLQTTFQNGERRRQRQRRWIWKNWWRSCDNATN